MSNNNTYILNVWYEPPIPNPGTSHLLSERISANNKSKRPHSPPPFNIETNLTETTRSRNRNKSQQKLCEDELNFVSGRTGSPVEFFGIYVRKTNKNVNDRSRDKQIKNRYKLVTQLYPNAAFDGHKCTRRRENHAKNGGTLTNARL